MNREEFNNQTLDEQLWLIYEKLVARETLQGESPIGGLFGKSEHFTPVRPKTQTPPGFTDIFGEEPDNKGARDIWKTKLARFGGIIDLSHKLDYSAKVMAALSMNLGVPIAYKYDGKEVVAFSRTPLLAKDISWYDTQWQNLVNLSLLELR